MIAQNRFTFRTTIVLAGVFLITAIANAQFQIPGQTGTTGTIGTGSETGGTNNGGGTSAQGLGLDNASQTANAAFGNIGRAESIGATGSTGAGFSSLSANPAGGGIGGLGGFGGGFGGLGGFGNLFGGQGSQLGQNATPAVRTRLRSAVDVPPMPSNQIQYSASQHLRSVSDPRWSGVGVTIHGQTAVVTGTVSTERDRRMSELLMRLEPGVRAVENRVIVTTPQLYSQ